MSSDGSGQRNRSGWGIFSRFVSRTPRGSSGSAAPRGSSGVATSRRGLQRQNTVHVMRGTAGDRRRTSKSFTAGAATSFGEHDRSAAAMARALDEIDLPPHLLQEFLAFEAAGVTGEGEANSNSGSSGGRNGRGHVASSATRTSTTTHPDTHAPGDGPRSPRLMSPGAGRHMAGVSRPHDGTPSTSPQHTPAHHTPGVASPNASLRPVGSLASPLASPLPVMSPSTPLARQRSSDGDAFLRPSRQRAPSLASSIGGTSVCTVEEDADAAFERRRQRLLAKARARVVAWISETIQEAPAKVAKMQVMSILPSTRDVVAASGDSGDATLTSPGTCRGSPTVVGCRGGKVAVPVGECGVVEGELRHSCCVCVLVCMFVRSMGGSMRTGIPGAARGRTVSVTARFMAAQKSIYLSQQPIPSLSKLLDFLDGVSSDAPPSKVFDVLGESHAALLRQQSADAARDLADAMKLAEEESQQQQQHSGQAQGDDTEQEEKQHQHPSLQPSGSVTAEGEHHCDAGADQDVDGEGKGDDGATYENGAGGGSQEAAAAAAGRVKSGSAGAVGAHGCGVANNGGDETKVGGAAGTAGSEGRGGSRAAASSGTMDAGTACGAAPAASTAAAAAPQPASPLRRFTEVLKDPGAAAVVELLRAFITKFRGLDFDHLHAINAPKHSDDEWDFEPPSKDTSRVFGALPSAHVWVCGCACVFNCGGCGLGRLGEWLRLCAARVPMAFDSVPLLCVCSPPPRENLACSSR